MYRVVGEAKLRSSVYYNDVETFERVLLVPGQTYMTLKPTSMDTLLTVSRDRTSDVQLSHMPSSNTEFYDKLPDSHELHVDENSKKPYVMFNHFDIASESNVVIPLEHEPFKTQHRYWYNKATGEVSWNRPLEPAKDVEIATYLNTCMSLVTKCTQQEAQIQFMRKTFMEYFGPERWEERWIEASPSMIGGVPPEKGMCDEYVVKLREAISEAVDSSRPSYDKDIHRLKRAITSQLDVKPFVIPVSLKREDIFKLKSFLAQEKKE